ncbi:hypothetical protein JOL62DRAFT_559176 [Phyllosticta paracitricarpa]|uniref:Non-ribosomal peptide synthetase n=1 Tax=Phyllosticta paracitricarpa TaxID=2016321 RepID=A0ABR1MZV1_9PEZI
MSSEERSSRSTTRDDNTGSVVRRDASRSRSRYRGQTPATSAMTLASGSTENTATVFENVKLEEGDSEDGLDEVAFTDLPEKKYPVVVRNLRHKIFIVYRRLFSLILIGNLAAFIWLVCHYRSLNVPASPLATATASNFCIAILIRQDYINNTIYDGFRLTPRWTPLRLRRIIAKCYENGGVHSGAAVSGSIWYVLLTAVLTYQFVKGQFAVAAPVVLALTYVLFTLLVAILIFAYPAMRAKRHNMFEYVHRFAGWSVVAVFWAEVLLLAENNRVANNITLGKAVIQEPSFWYQIIITIHLIYPWFLLRKVPFKSENLSNHAIRLTFSEKLGQFRGVALATTPLGQYHAFATFPNPTEADPNGQSIVLSNAGDWTKAQMGDNQEREYYLRGLPKAGVLAMATIFRNVVLVCTGSGIGPILSFINLGDAERTNCRVMWSAPNPLKIFGQSTMDMVKKADKDAIIWNTKEQGRPDMLRMTYDLYKQSGAEAVFVISNPSLTKMIVYGLESRGVPAFGPIWDS